MKTPSDELFNLISSLTTQEKVHFKINYSKKKADNNTVILFDAINSLKHYDEKILKEKLKNKLPIKDLHVLKNYTIDAILKSLRNYYLEDSIESIIHFHLQDIYILIKKRLFAYAKKIIAKVEKIAIENDKYNYHLIILSLKRDIMMEEISLNDISTYRFNQYLQEIKCIDILKNNIDYSMLYMEIESIAYNMTSYQFHEIEALLKNPLLKDEKKALSISAKLKYHATLANSYRLMSQWKKTYIHYKKVFLLFEQMPSNLNSNIEFYLIMIARFLRILVRLNKTDELNILYGKVEDYKKSLPKKLQFGSMSEAYWTIKIAQIDIALFTFEIETALKYSEEIKESIKTYYNPVTFLLFNINFFYIHFFYNDFRKALGVLNEILNMKDFFGRQDIIQNVKIFNLVVHYELGNEELLKSLSKSAFRYFKNEKLLGEAEKIIIHFFEKVIHTIDTGEQRKKAFLELKTKLEPILIKENNFDHFDFISWIDSKLENRSFLEIAKKRKTKHHNPI